MNGHDLTYNLGGVWRNGKGQAPCPCCQPERRKDQNALSISESGGKLLLYCFKTGCGFRDIADAANLPPNSAQVDPQAQLEADQKRREYEQQKLNQARGIWEASRPIERTKAEAYLRGRGITCPLPQSLRFAPDIFHGPSTSWCMAMVASVSTGGIHRTFFDKRGNRLQKNAKMMLGPCSGGAVPLSEAQGPLVVCEGIETGLSLLSGLLSEPATVWATLSTSGMKALRLPDKPGALTIATDGDPAGREAGNALASRAHALGWNVSLMPAPDGQDWNDALTEGAVK
ncbi:toprim domain-containing protein [Ruegeria sp. R13_0]|uniref:DUF7146 domain-containing protein n=1 Tax=Ruegeria sp. R13_0 TaxID=2821099 RepID=UPI001AD98F37|nr:toprim domain-containing protein [Ruegeria sp. R13_0]MBO9432569.1 toprim domain-containing protein [Ruegeria sp. R13_0]